MTTVLTTDDDFGFKLNEIHRLTVETHSAVSRLELGATANHGVLLSIEKNTGTVAQFFAQLDTVTRLAAGKNQVPISLVIVMLILGAVGVFIVILRGSNLELNVPWAGISVTHAKEGGHDEPR